MGAASKSKKSANGAAAAASQQSQQSQSQSPVEPAPVLELLAADDGATTDAADKKKKKKKKKSKAAASAVAAEENEEEEEDNDVDVGSASAGKPGAFSSTIQWCVRPASFLPNDLTVKAAKSTYDESRYPRPQPGQTKHPRVPFFTAISTYFAYGLLIAVGHLRDLINRWGILRTEKSSPQVHTGEEVMAPLVSDFDDFYTRRLYHRIESAWNRPISSCPASVTDVMMRSREGGYGTPFKLTGETKSMVNLGSYNYLGFGDPNSPTKHEVLEALDRYSVCTTSTRTNLGTTTLHAELESLVAHFVGKESSMIFGMGFATNSTGIPALVGKGGLIISDQNNHSSIACGARTSGAVIRVFKHNDLVSLEAVIRHAIIQGQPKTHRPWTKILIIIEGIYSMEGEMSPLKEIVALKKKYGCYLFVDEAHSIGAIGANGRGICEYSGVPPSEVDVLMGTFTKSFGATGGYIAADRDIIDFMRANSAGSVYSTSISPPAVQQALSAFRIMLHADGTDTGRRKLDQLRENSNYFRQKLVEMGCHVLGDWDSPIVMLMLYHPAKIQSFSEECLKRGLATVVVGFPATPLLLARVRICLSAGHTREQLDYTLMQIEDVADLLGMKYKFQQI